jgi:hypothetical protein
VTDVLKSPEYKRARELEGFHPNRYETWGSVGGYLWGSFEVFIDHDQYQSPKPQRGDGPRYYGLR